MNIVWIAIDSLRADRLGCYGYRRPTSPFIDQLAMEGICFERFYAPAVPTQPSFTTTFTGQLPTTHGIVAHRGRWALSEDAPFLPELLKDAGYATVAVDNLADQHQPWFFRGFDLYLNPREPGSYPPCFAFNREAIEWLKTQRQEPFFLFIHYWDPHTPYMPPPEYRTLFYEGDPTIVNPGSLESFYARPLVPGWIPKWLDVMAQEWEGAKGSQITDIEFVRSQYDAEVRCADDGVRELVGALEELGLLEETALFLFGDHGEELGEHGIYFDHHGLYEGNIHPPLIIRLGASIERRQALDIRDRTLDFRPSTSRPQRLMPLVQHCDLAPTVLALCGLTPPETMDGRSLLPLTTHRSPLTHSEILLTEECTWMAKWAIVRDGWKLIVAREPDFYGKPMRELYDLTTDPGEQHDLIEEQPEIARELGDTLESELSHRLARAGRTEDPVREHGITLGKRMFAE